MTDTGSVTAVPREFEVRNVDRRERALVASSILLVTPAFTFAGRNEIGDASDLITPTGRDAFRWIRRRRRHHGLLRILTAVKRPLQAKPHTRRPHGGQL